MIAPPSRAPPAPPAPLLAPPDPPVPGPGPVLGPLPLGPLVEGVPPPVVLPVPGPVLLAPPVALPEVPAPPPDPARVVSRGPTGSSEHATSVAKMTGTNATRTAEGRLDMGTLLMSVGGDRLRLSCEFAGCGAPRAPARLEISGVTASVAVAVGVAVG